LISWVVDDVKPSFDTIVVVMGENHDEKVYEEEETGSLVDRELAAFLQKHRQT
jgi:hypothetical protein